jgi:hypothetical protein
MSKLKLKAPVINDTIRAWVHGEDLYLYFTVEDKSLYNDLFIYKITDPITGYSEYGCSKAEELVKTGAIDTISNEDILLG